VIAGTGRRYLRIGVESLDDVQRRVVDVAAFAARADPEIATMLLVRGCYVFLAVLVAAVWFRPLA